MPLVDHRIVARAVDLPASARAGLRSPKAILRKAIADLVPDEILRQPKRGFPVPVARFLLEDPDHSLGTLLLSEQSLARELFRPDAVRGLVEGTSSGPDRELKLFTLAALELWLRANVDVVSVDPPTSLDAIDSMAIRTHA